METKMTDAPKLVDWLNGLVAIDAECVRRLIEARMPCNEAMADHPHVQVAPAGDGFEVGLLGILNGMVGPSGERIAAMFEDGGLERFVLLDAEQIRKVDGA